MITDAERSPSRKAALHRGAGRPVRRADRVVQLTGQFRRGRDHHHGQQGGHRTFDKDRRDDHARAGHSSGRRSVAERCPGGPGSDIAFESGTAAFKINYPYVWPSAQKDSTRRRSSSRWAMRRSRASCREPLPRCRSVATTSGVSAFSKHQELAFDGDQVPDPGELRDHVRG